jgi:hypothetical protein
VHHPDDTGLVFRSRCIARTKTIGSVITAVVGKYRKVVDEVA